MSTESGNLSQSSPSVPSNSSLELQVDTLEPRIMLSASWSDGDIDVSDTLEVDTSDPNVQNELANELTHDQADDGFFDDDDLDTHPSESEDRGSEVDASVAEPGQHVVLIDGNLDDIDQLQASVEEGLVIVLDSESGTVIDALAQVESAAEEGNFQIESLAVFSHGENGSIEFGSDSIRLGMLPEQQDAWSSLADNFSSDSQIHFYACDAASGTEGHQLLDAISEITGADVFGSDDLTGTSGDWDLEYSSNSNMEFSSGSLSFEMLADYQHDLSGQAQFSDVDSSKDAVSEDAAEGTSVGITLEASVESDELTYRIVDEKGNLDSDSIFAIDAGTGVVFVRDSGRLDSETASSHQVRVQASNGESTTTKSFTIDVLAVDKSNHSDGDWRDSSGQSISGPTESDDTFKGTSGNDVAEALGGDDILFGGEGDDFLEGGDGNDKIDGGTGDDILFGGDGDDQLTGERGDDLIIGGEGFDTISFQSASSGVKVNLENETAVGDGSDRVIGFEKVIGTSFSDQIVGDDLANELIGGDGNDVIEGASGDDNISGDSGADQLDGGAGNDKISGGAGNDQLLGGDGSDVLSGDSGQDNLKGGSGNDILDGGSGNDVIDGGSGDDLIRGGTGNDSLVGGSGVDTVDYSGSNAVSVDLGAGISSGNGSDALEGFENVIGSSESDKLSGDEGSNELQGGEGDDTLQGGGGLDTLRGGFGNDTIYADETDQVFGDEGIDTVNFETAKNGVTFDASEASIENVVGSHYDDVFSFSNATDQDVYQINGGLGANTINLSNFDVGDITVKGDVIAVSLSDGGSFEIQFSDINHIHAGGVDSPTLNIDDFTVQESSRVEIAAIPFSGSNEAVTVSWSQVSGPPVEIADAETTRPSFETPNLAADSMIRLKVEISEGESTSTEYVSINITAINDPISVQMGPDQQVSEGDVVTLTASVDDPEGRSTIQSWRQVSGPPVELEGPLTGSPVFTVPDLQQDTTLVFEVVASDGENEVREQTSVTVLAENEAAVVDAGDDRSVSEGETVQLFANASDPEGATLAYQWVQTGGPPVSLTDINTPSPTFVAPDGVSNVSLEFEVRVSDGENVSVDRVGVEVNGVDDAPKFLTAENVEAEEGQAVQLFAEAIDPEGKGLEYRWSQVGGPSIDLAGVNTQTPSFIAPEGIVNTYVTFEVSASDGVNTTLDIVDVLVNGDNDAPSVDAGSDFTVKSTEIAALSATSADPEGMSVSHRWTQLEGPAVAIRSPNSSEASFLAPRVTESSTLVFQVEVSDGHSTSIDTVSITVDPVETSVPPTGDGGSTGEPDIKLSAPPTIVAEEGSTAELSINVHGSSDGLQYSWRQVAGSVPIDLSNADTANPTFEAPELVDNELYVFEATVQDNDESKTVNVFVRIQADNDGPSVTIDDSDTQLSKDIYELGAVTSDPENQNLSYRWTQVGGPAVKLLTDDSPSLRYSTANLSVESEVTFQLVVSDGTSVATDTVTMMGQPGNAAPNVDAGSDQKVTEGETVRLSSVASDSGYTELSYQWVQTGGPPVTLSDPNADSPNFDAPDLIDDAEITFKLTVSDGVLESSDSVTIHVAAQNDPPTVDAGPFQVVDEGEPVTLQATGTDPEGQDLQYKWRQIGGVPVSLVDYDSPTPSFTAPNDVVNSYLTFEVHATDGEQTVVDRVMLLVNADNDAPKSDAGSDMTVSETTLVQLSGTATDPENQPLAHTWVQTSGPPVALSDVASLQPTFEAPNVLEATQITFELSTTDGTHTTVDSVTVTVTGDNDAATAVNATTIIAEDTQESVVLNAIDPDLGDTIESFRIESLPDVGVLLFDGETVTVGNHFSASEIGEGALTFIPPGDWSGTTSFEFSASDGEQWSPVGIQSLVVSGVADVATISTSDAMGLEDTLIPLEVKVSLTDADGSESITKLSVTGAPNGTVFTDGENTVVVSDGQAEITKFDLEQLQIQPAVHYDTNMTLSFAVTTTEPDSGHSTVTVETLDLKITAVQDAPVAEDSQVTIEEDTVTTVKLKATEFDTGDQVETYRIESLPPQGNAST